MGLFHLILIWFLYNSNERNNLFLSGFRIIQRNYLRPTINFKFENITNENSLENITPNSLSYFKLFKLVGYLGSYKTLKLIPS